MSRVIKFRVWNGSEMIYDVVAGKFGVFYVNPEDRGDGLHPMDSSSLTPFTTKFSDGTPVMQFTGLHDKNGKEIYEGDIVRFDANYLPPRKPAGWLNGVIVMTEYRLILKVGDNEYDASEETEEFPYTAKVIGNIYQNPELTKA